jgi:hypothetical protein
MPEPEPSVTFHGHLTIRSRFIFVPGTRAASLARGTAPVQRPMAKSNEGRIQVDGGPIPCFYDRLNGIQKIRPLTRRFSNPRNISLERKRTVSFAPLERGAPCVTTDAIQRSSEIMPRPSRQEEYDKDRTEQIP